MIEDSAIIELYNQRDEAAIRETKIKYGKLLYKVSYNIVADARDAQECASDTYLNVWNSIPPFRPSNFKAFILKTVRNISVNRLKASRAKRRGGGGYQLALHEIEGIFDSDGKDSLIDEIALKDALNRFLGSLPDENRMIFIGRYWYFESIKDIAENLDVGVSKVKMVLLRCRNELKKYLLKEGFTV